MDDIYSSVSTVLAVHRCKAIMNHDTNTSCHSVSPSSYLASPITAPFAFCTFLRSSRVSAVDALSFIITLLVLWTNLRLVLRAACTRKASQVTVLQNTTACTVTTELTNEYRILSRLSIVLPPPNRRPPQLACSQLGSRWFQWVPGNDTRSPPTSLFFFCFCRAGGTRSLLCPPRLLHDSKWVD